MFIGDTDVTHQKTGDRDVGMVFESDALFPTYTARGNVGFPLKVRSMPKSEIDNRVIAESRAMGIDAILDRWPSQLSAGHRRLVQIARAMVRAPNVFLLDEPLATVDPPTRARLRRDLREMQSGYGVTTLYATNDPDEAMAIADRVAVIVDGRIRQVDTPRAVYRSPASRLVAGLTGDLCTFEANVERDETAFVVASPSCRLRSWATRLEREEGRQVTVGVRPIDVVPDDNGPVRAVLGAHSFLASRPARQLLMGDIELWTLARDLPDEGVLTFRFDRWHVFGRDDMTIAHIE